MIEDDGMSLTEGAGDLAGFPWPDGTMWEEARAWLEPMVREGTTVFVKNAPTDLRLLRVGEAVLPVTVDEPGPGRSYVVSPWAQYVDYASEELSRLPKRWQRWGGAALLQIMRPWLRRAQMDRVVQVNNWLLSTNLWPAGMAEDVARIVLLLRRIWPDRAVIFRSLDLVSQPGLVNALKAAGARMVFSRIVTYQDPAAPLFWRNRQLRQDRKRFVREGWQAEPVGTDVPGQAVELKRLYDALYLEKYSRLNPDFTEKFFTEALKSKFVRMELLRQPGGPPAGVWGWWVRGGVMTQPVFGYDPSGPRGAAPYAALSLRVLERAAELGLKVNASGGAGRFKQQRGGIATVEWHAVFDDHLPASARRPWAVLERLVGPRIQEVLRGAGL